MTRLRWWLLLLLLSAGLILLDLVTGPYLLFPITFVLPVGLAAWHLGRGEGLFFAVALVAGRFAIASGTEQGIRPMWANAANAAIRLVILVALAWLIDRVAAQQRALRERVDALEGILPICSFCKKIRLPDGRWEQIERYVSQRSTARFSHGFCEECGREHYGVLAEPPPPGASPS